MNGSPTDVLFLSRVPNMVPTAVLFCAMFILSPPSFSSEGKEGLELLWRYSAGGKVTALTYDEVAGVVYAVAEDRYLHAVSIGGKTLWRSYTGHGRVNDLKIGCDGSIYFAAADGKLSALNRTGGFIWSVRPFDGTDGSEREEGAVIGIIPLEGGTVLAIGREGQIAAYSHAGVLRWRARIFGPGTAGGVSAFSLVNPKATDPGSSVFVVGFEGGDVVTLSQNGVEMRYIEYADSIRYTFPGGKAAPGEEGDVGTGDVGVGPGDVEPGPVVLSGGELQWLGQERDVLAKTEVGEVVAAASGPTSHTTQATSGPNARAKSASTAGAIAVRNSMGFLGLYKSGEELWKKPVGGGSCLLALGVDAVVLLDNEGWCEIYSREGERKTAQRLPVPASEPLVYGGGLLLYGDEDWLLRGYRIPGESEENSAAVWSKRGNYHCVSRREGKNGAPFPVMQEELRYGNRQRKRSVLKRVEKRLDSAEPMDNKIYYITVLEGLASEGVLSAEYLQGEIVNDYPEIRSEAVQLIGRYGDHASARFLRSLLANEWDAAVSLHCIEAIGRLGGTDDASATALFLRMLESQEYRGNDPASFASTVLEAVERIARYRGVFTNNVMEILKTVYLGSFPRSIRNEAISTIRGLKGSAYMHFKDYTGGESEREER